MHGVKVLKDLTLVAMLAKSDLKNRYASSYGGIAWNLGLPLLYASINVVVFSILMSGRMGSRYGDIPFALFFFVPLTLWTVFSESAIRSTSIMREYAYLINKIAFPFWVLPLVPLASALLSQGILLTVVGCLMVYYGIAPAASAPFYLVAWLVCLMLTVGISYAIAAFAVYVPDLAQIVPVGVNILFWLTPILYPPSVVEHGAASWARSIIMEFNPFFYIVELSRAAFFGSAPLAMSVLFATTLAAFMVLISGLFVFKKLKHGFADVI